MDKTGLAMELRADGYVVSGKGERRACVKAPQKRRYRSKIKRTASSSDTAVVHKLHFIQCYQKARTEDLSERNI
jgi:hypothetical protein